MQTYKVVVWKTDDHCKYAKDGDLECLFTLQVEAESKFRAGHKVASQYPKCIIYSVENII